MEDQLSLPHDVYTRLIEAAEDAGTTPVGWLEKNLPEKKSEHEKPETMADVLRDYIGKYSSDGTLRASERVNELFGEYLEQKRREGRL